MLRIKVITLCFLLAATGVTFASVVETNLRDAYSAKIAEYQKVIEKQEKQVTKSDSRLRAQYQKSIAAGTVSLPDSNSSDEDSYAALLVLVEEQVQSLKELMKGKPFKGQGKAVARKLRSEGNITDKRLLNNIAYYVNAKYSPVKAEYLEKIGELELLLEADPIVVPANFYEEQEAVAKPPYCKPQGKIALQCDESVSAGYVAYRSSHPFDKASDVLNQYIATNMSQFIHIDETKQNYVSACEGNALLKANKSENYCNCVGEKMAEKVVDLAKSSGYSPSRLLKIESKVYGICK